MKLNSYLLKHLPGQIVIQITDHCNATCPQCSMRVTEKYPRNLLCQDAIKKILKKAANSNVKALSFTGGEPLLHTKLILRMITYAKDLGINYIRTGTNQKHIFPMYVWVEFIIFSLTPLKETLTHVVTEEMRT